MTKKLITQRCKCRYWPGVDQTRLPPDYSGIRPKLKGPDATGDRAESGIGAADFAAQGREPHGVAGLVNFLGIESPELTATLAVADHVADLLERDLE